ncbi:alpha-hydroxy acid oxidase [Cellulomonas marina]|uniref:alpha-hydroxy acid oxidase n=1 Tax=Cellulomonas marina TaxID=988821 RepID=UPI000B7F668A|nr:alpha-hydroxy acid oxidase [Cellulomonas marina]GIG29715.1 alpha-hydroxy-acid oxidizing enzyme [Cellulomonas marina]
MAQTLTERPGTGTADREELARTLLPPEVYAYYASGSGAETTLAEAARAWSAFRLRPRTLRDVRTVSTAARLLGTDLALPVGVAPMAFHALAHPEAERATAAGTDRAGGLFVLSTRCSLRIEDVAAAAGPWWFQVYVMRDRSLTRALVERAAAAGARALLLTGDTPYVGAKRAVGGVRIPLSAEHFLVNLAEHLPADPDVPALTEQDPSIDTDVIAWLQEVSGLPVLVKGVLRGDEAVRCLDAGAAGVVVSNHGGRQLDRAVPAALALAEVVDAVGGRAPVLVDGGVRSGLDVLVALALGADAVLLGRPVLWALAAGGADGVADLLDQVRAELSHAMALVGSPDVAALDRSLVVPAPILPEASP